MSNHFPHSFFLPPRPIVPTAHTLNDFDALNALIINDGPFLPLTSGQSSNNDTSYFDFAALLEPTPTGILPTSLIPFTPVISATPLASQPFQNFLAPPTQPIIDPNLLIAPPQPPSIPDFIFLQSPPNPLLAAPLMQAFNLLTKGVAPYLFCLTTYLSKHPDVKIYEWKCDTDGCFDLLAALLTAFQIKDLNIFAQMLASSVPENICLELIESMESPANKFIPFHLEAPIIQGICNIYRGSEAYLVEEKKLNPKNANHASLLSFYASIIYKPELGQYYYIHVMDRDGCARAVPIRPAHFQEDLKNFMENLNIRRHKMKSILIKSWKIHMFPRSAPIPKISLHELPLHPPLTPHILLPYEKACI